MTWSDDVPPGSGRMYRVPPGSYVEQRDRVHEPGNVRIDLSCLPWVDAEKLLLPRKSKKVNRKKSYYHN